jgi:hypothetical protein
MVGMSETISMAAPPFFGGPADLNQTGLKVNGAPEKGGPGKGVAHRGVKRIFFCRRLTLPLRRKLRRLSYRSGPENGSGLGGA